MNNDEHLHGGEPAEEELDLIEAVDEDGNSVLLEVVRYFFYNGIPSTEQTLSEAETAYLESVWGKIYTDVTRLPVAEMEKMVQRYFGLSLQEMKGIGLSSMTYWAQTDCYYIQHGDTNRKLLTIYDARVQDDGTLNL